MRSIPAPVLTKIQEGLTTLACCWTLTRRDGQVFRFTSHHLPIVVGGHTFEANSAIVPSTMKATHDTAMDNLSVEGIIRSDGIKALDILAGRYNHASIEFALVDYLLPEEGLFCQEFGSIGEVELKGPMFEVELRLTIQKMSRPITEVTSIDCRAMRFCDSRCRLNVLDYTFAGTVTSVVSTEHTLVSTTTAIASKALGYFANGELKWLTGQNAGIVCDIKQSDAGQIELQKRLVYPIAVGDQFEAIAGCDRRLETCRDKFNNVINFVGEPHIPGVDFLKRTVVQ